MSNTLAGLRAQLFETLAAVKNGTMDLNRARAVNELAKTVVDTAKVEVDFLHTVKGTSSPFIEGEAEDDETIGGVSSSPFSQDTPSIPGAGQAEVGAGITGVRQHRIGG